MSEGGLFCRRVVMVVREALPCPNRKSLILGSFDSIFLCFSFSLRLPHFFLGLELANSPYWPHLDP